MPNKVFGIDLGTTYSVIAYVDEYGRPVVVPNADSQLTTPSVVLFASPSEVVVGMQAKRQSRVRPDEVASLVKRHMGDGEWRFPAHGQDYSAPAVASQVIAELAASAVRARELEYEIGLPGEGAESEVFFSDLSTRYVTVNAEYTT